MRFLIIDDFDLGIELVKQAILSKGLPQESISTAVSGKTAIELIKESIATKSPYDIIFLDLVLPDFNGMEVLKYIREQKQLDSCKVVVITGETEQVTAKEVKQMGGNVFLPKPVNRNQIVLIIDSFSKK